MTPGSVSHAHLPDVPKVELLIHGVGVMGATYSASMNASAGGGFGAASSDGAFDMMEVDVLGLGTQGW